MTKRSFSRAKIVATLGPRAPRRERASARCSMPGADVFRLNFSHGSHDEHQRALSTTSAGSRRRPAGRSASSPICRGRSCASATFAARPGRPRRRRELPPRPRPDARRRRARAAAASRDLRRRSQPGTAAAARRRQAAARGRVDCGADSAEARVIVGGPLSDRKGVNVPRRRPADFGADREGPRATSPSRSQLGVDWIALSFVQRPEDVAEVRAARRQRPAGSWPSWRSPRRSSGSTRSSRRRTR